MSSNVCGLDQKNCVPCEGGVAALSRLEAEKMLNDVASWGFAKEGKAISRRFTFKNFKQAIAFVNKVGELAESEGHHPDISLGWGYAEFLMWTHAIGGLHENDFIMASKINALNV
jgi:4a-hydroxytetrahydrobiopterin dehydratase